MIILPNHLLSSQRINMHIQHKLFKARITSFSHKRHIYLQNSRIICHTICMAWKSKKHIFYQGSFALDQPFYGHQNLKKIAIFICEIIMHKLLYQVLTKFACSLKLSKDSASVFCFELILFQLFCAQIEHFAFYGHQHRLAQMTLVFF